MTNVAQSVANSGRTGAPEKPDRRAGQPALTLHLSPAPRHRLRRSSAAQPMKVAARGASTADANRGYFPNASLFTT